MERVPAAAHIGASQLEVPDARDRLFPDPWCGVGLGTGAGRRGVGRTVAARERGRPSAASYLDVRDRTTGAGSACCGASHRRPAPRHGRGSRRVASVRSGERLLPRARPAAQYHADCDAGAAPQLRNRRAGSPRPFCDGADLVAVCRSGRARRHQERGRPLGYRCCRRWRRNTCWAPPSRTRSDTSSACTTREPV